MRSFSLPSALALAVLLSVPLLAWNFSGHWIVAAIAYDRLTPHAREWVDDLIRHHPDYDRFIKDAPSDPAARAKYAFVHAASWPDELRGDERFYDESRPDSKTTPLLPGFPDMGRHMTWHYFDIPFSDDGSSVEQQPPPHILSELTRLIAEESDKPTAAQASYDLVWIEHLVGDAHQPLHATSRYSQSLPKGDAGGNFVYVGPGRNLHALWDDAAAPRDLPYGEVLRFAGEISGEDPPPKNSGSLSLDPETWLRESFVLDRSDVYTFGRDTGTREHPLTLPAGYEENARRIARQRVALAGYRLAEILNRAFH